MGAAQAVNIAVRLALTALRHSLHLRHRYMACTYSIAAQLKALGQHRLAGSQHSLCLWHQGTVCTYGIMARLALMASQHSLECWGGTGCHHCGAAHAYGITAWLGLTALQRRLEPLGGTGWRDRGWLTFMALPRGSHLRHHGTARTDGIAAQRGAPGQHGAGRIVAWLMLIGLRHDSG